METQIVNSKSEIENSLKTIIKKLFDLNIQPQVEVAQDLSKGDYSTNLAMIAFSKIKNNKSNLKSPMEVADEIVKHLKLEIARPASLGGAGGNLRFLDRVEVKYPGFINFWLSEKEVIKQIERVLDFSKFRKDKSSELILEFGDLNPFKEPHIGHLRNLALGEALVRLLEFSGTKVIRANYEGDVGLHVAKAIWGILQISNFENKSLEEKAKLLGKAYALGAKAYEENENAKHQITQINIKIYRKDSDILQIWEKGKQWSLEYFDTLYRTLGIKYEKYYFESETAPEGFKIVKHNPDVFEKHDGALIFRGEKFGLHTRVFVTKEGYATYEGKDLGLAILKNKDYPNADSIIMTANEQVDYFKVLLKALDRVDKKIAAKTTHLSYGAVNLKEEKMSSRTGNVVPAFWLLDEIKKRLKKGFKTVKNDVLEQLAVGSVKWSMLKFSRESNISFSIEESIDIAGNSGPYMQYTYARTQSLLSKSSIKSFEANSVKNLEEEELALGRIICQFEIMANDAGKNFSPNILSNYLYNLAQNFNHYYEKEKIIGSDKEIEKLVVIKAVGEVIKKGLYLLGIESPEKI